MPEARVETGKSTYSIEHIKAKLALIYDDAQGLPATEQEEFIKSLQVKDPTLTGKLLRFIIRKDPHKWDANDWIEAFKLMSDKVFPDSN